MSSPADLVVTGGRIWTQDPGRPWAEALAVRDGKIVAVGSAAEAEAFTGPDTQVHDAGGAMIMPGLIDGHVHLNLGGSQAAFELPLAPTDDLDTILGRIGEWAAGLGPDAWVVGGIVGSTVLDGLADAAVLARLDEASGGRPVLLRDDSMHNRWVNSRALALMGVGPASADPDGGRYVRDGNGCLTGVLHESASAEAEAAFTRSITDVQARTDTAVATAIETLNSYGVTSAQEAATMLGSARALAALEASGGLNARVVLSMPVRPFLEDGLVGEELIAEVAELRGELVRPDFVKIVMDGVPMTRTTALLSPYRCGHGAEPTQGEMYWTLDDLVAQLKRCAELGLGAKLHATGDASARRVLDAAERLRNETASGIRLQIAHAEFVHPDDVPRFAEVNVVADLSPYIWYPSVIQDSIAEQVEPGLVESSWPMRDLVDSGAVVAAGSDWPCAAPTPDPWTGLETLVTRRNPDERFPGTLNPKQELTLEEAIAAFTSNPADALGIGDIAGRLAPGCSADFIVLDRNLFEIDPRDIHATRVQRTYFAGRLVHENPDGKASCAELTP
ncbi:amidohydrolase [Saccharopolyspora aridisoli]|uniref:Amidohydrolase n=1 Tax=Saccharopolyspora aridisoli TaxID=2530385 RepID=A0A4R4UNP9_9PSEU|nr:amidohydrolase [Saccharopolyspora aridisoli]TDC93491.1 amidohydrolase [Saccharopolyspora aridisoli]